MSNDYGITLEDAIAELQHEVPEAINFMSSEFAENWEKAERYYAGECDVPTEEGRSNAVKTEVRDIIRAAKPSIMRVLYQAKTPVEFVPKEINQSALVAQQNDFVIQHFRANSGFEVLSDVVDQALRLKAAPIKTWWEADPAPVHINFTGLTAEEVNYIENMPDVDVLDVELSPNLGEELELYDVECRQYEANGKIHIECFPIYEFFINRTAKCPEDAKVHGHHRNITVGEAIDMGLEYDDWDDLVGADPASSQMRNVAQATRGYSTAGETEDSNDLLQKEILLTEVYCKFDLDGDGKSERYCFYLGGEGYKYIDHYEIEDYCIDLAQCDPQPNSPIGGSLADITIEMQDNNTSILRAIIDNAHMANNPRMAADPNNTDFSDVMNNATGAPIKTRGTPQIQIIDIPFTGQTLIPFLEYLETDTEQRAGITKAATGLDPDALQSTDKDAVLNTIQLSQGQLELMTRNIVETGLVGAFRKFLRLSIRHMDKIQTIRSKGLVIPVDTAMFNPDLAVEVNVGLGTASHNEKVSTLSFILSKQEQIIKEYGMDNPFTNLAQIYNTLEDITMLGGFNDPSRYFNVVTPAMEKKIARSMADAAAKQAEENPPPMDPSKALIQVEGIKANVRKLEVANDARNKELELQYKALKDQEELDLKRDDMIQDRMMQLREIGQDRLNAIIERKQEANNADKAAFTSVRKNSPSSRVNGSATMPTSGGQQSRLNLDQPQRGEQ